MNVQNNRKRLGKMVKADRMRLYRTVDKARIKANVSRGAWDNVEKGKPAKDFTLGAIEDALGWPAGRAQSIIDGGDASDLERTIANSILSPKAIEQILEIVRRETKPPTPPKEVKGA